MPRFLIGRWNIRVTVAYKGLLWVGGPQVDPGWVGHLFCPIYNLSDQEVNFKLSTTGLKGYMQDIFRKVNVNLAGSKTSMKLAPFESRIYIDAAYKKVKPTSIYIPLNSESSGNSKEKRKIR